jgi:hypothetical protein
MPRSASRPTEKLREASGPAGRPVIVSRVETLPRGTALDPGDLRIPGAPTGAVIEIERGLGECPHGFWYEAFQGDVRLLLTVLDPVLVAQADVRAHIVRDVEKRMTVSHKNLLPCYGVGTSRTSGVRVFIAEAWPGGGTVREFVKQRTRKGQRTPSSRTSATRSTSCTT